MPLRLVKGRHGSPYWYIRGSVRGQSVDESTGTDQREAAEALRIKKEKELLDQSIYGISAVATFAQAADGYTETGGSDLYLKPLILRWSKTPCAQIDQKAIDQAASELYPKASGSTRNRQVYTPAIAVLHWASSRDMCPWRRFKRPKVGAGRIRYITPPEAEKFLSCASDSLRPLAIFLLYTGCRLGEALALEWRDISLSKARASIPQTKTDTPRAISLHPRVVKALEPLGHSKTGTRVFSVYSDRWQVYDDWGPALRAAGLVDFTPHDCRHTFATWLRRYGGLDTLGLLATGAWKDPKSVARYAHVAPDEAQAAIAKLPGKIRGPKKQKGKKPA